MGGAIEVGGGHPRRGRSAGRGWEGGPIGGKTRGGGGGGEGGHTRGAIKGVVGGHTRGGIVNVAVGRSVRNAVP